MAQSDTRWCWVWGLCDNEADVIADYFGPCSPGHLMVDESGDTLGYYCDFHGHWEDWIERKKELEESRRVLLGEHPAEALEEDVKITRKRPSRESE